MKEEIGIEGTALKWFTSFMTGRTQKVKIRDSYSEEGDLIYGVAQGSVLGPALFNIYIRSLKKPVDPTKFSIFGFADDHQLIKPFLPVLQLKALDGDVNECFRLIEEWTIYDHYTSRAEARNKNKGYFHQRCVYQGC